MSFVAYDVDLRLLEFISKTPDATRKQIKVFFGTPYSDPVQALRKARLIDGIDEFNLTPAGINFLENKDNILKSRMIKEF